LGKKAVSVIMLTLLLTGMLTLAFKIELVSAIVPPEPEYPAIYVDPPVVEGVTPGNNVTVSIKTNCTEPIQAWQFDLSFNASILHGINVTNGDLLIPGLPFFTFMPGTFNNTEGTLSLTGAFWFPHIGPSPITPPSGPRTLANVTFTVVGYGTSYITLGPNTQYIGYDPGDPEIQPHPVIDAATMPEHIGYGYFSNILPGDGDFNGLVEMADFYIWREFFGQPHFPEDVYPDYNGDGFVDMYDFYVWVTHFGESV